ncbi:MAG: ribokinase [Roseimicrobium sp.]
MPDPSPTPAIAVVGSLNLDTILNVPCLPKPGATVAATGWESRYGGKGANQALAACRQGGATSIIGCIGDDAGGRAYLDYLQANGVSCSGLQRLTDVPTGRAYVSVDPEGENTIVTAAGANAYLNADLVMEHASVIANADLVLCQLEVPVEAAVCALQTATELGKLTLLNASPLSPDFPWGQVRVDFLIVNATEAKGLLGYAVESTQEAATVRSQMADLGVGTLIITSGAEHTFLFGTHQALRVPPPQVAVVDSTGAGDAFAGAFAVHWLQTHNLLHSLRQANIAGALACTRLGAQDAIPTRREVADFGKEPTQNGEPDLGTEDA